MADLKSAYQKMVADNQARHPWVFYTFLYGIIEQHTWGEYFRDKKKDHHLSPEKICALFRNRALQQFGRFTNMVMEFWRVESAEDLGRAVFQLADQQCFFLSGHEKMEDFQKAGLFFK